MKKHIFILLIFGLHSFCGFSQGNQWIDCKPSIKGYNIYLQPKSVAIGINETLYFNVVFDGQKDYIISYCANKIYYPIHVRLLRVITREALYDNATDNYPLSIGVGFSNTQNLIIEISLLADKLSSKEKRGNTKAYINMFLHYKKISSNIEIKKF